MASLPTVIAAGQSVVWLNATDESRVRIEVAGFFDDSQTTPDPEACFSVAPERATTIEALAPGDAVCLRFPTPGVYHYGVRGGVEDIQGSIIVREE